VITIRNAQLSLAAVVILASGCTSTPQPTQPTPEPSIATEAPPAPVIADDDLDADPDEDLGAGKPGAFCATSRRGKQFTKRGVTYTCKGPKPYRWRSS
jgi:hypothetical protein